MALGRVAGIFKAGGRTTVMTSDTNFVLSAIEFATTLNCRLALTDAGAVYVVGVPLGVLVGAIVPQPGLHAVPF